MSLPSRGDYQGVYKLVIARLQQPSQEGLFQDGYHRCVTKGSETAEELDTTLKKETGMTGGTLDLAENSKLKKKQKSPTL